MHLQHTDLFSKRAHGDESKVARYGIGVRRPMASDREATPRSNGVLDSFRLFWVGIIPSNSTIASVFSEHRSTFKWSSTYTADHHRMQRSRASCRRGCTGAWCSPCSLQRSSSFLRVTILQLTVRSFDTSHQDEEGPAEHH